MIYIHRVIGALLVCWFTFSCSDSTSEPAPNYNIIYILADDLGYGDLSCYGQEYFTTPNIDRLAAEGMVFTQHYAGSTVCAPSRSSLMTGLHTGHTFIRGNKEVKPEGQYPIPDSTYTLAEMLRGRGYRAGAFGKWGLGPPGSEGDPLQQGFDEFYGYNCQRLAHHYYPRFLWNNDQRDSLPGNFGQAKGQYAPDLIHERALKFIEKNQNRPFFLFYPNVIPHAELAAADSLIEKYDSLLPSGQPYRGYDAGPEYRLGRYESQDRPHAAFAAMIETLDQQVGDIMQKLDELDLAERTLVIFTSDNGPHLEAGADPDFFDSNGPLRGYKRDLYEGGIRVPMIAHCPGFIAPGQQTDHISAFWDVFPTLAALTGAPPPAVTDGISFLPTLQGESNRQNKHSYLYWEFHEKGGRVAIRRGNWKGVRYDVLEDPDSPLELYDLTKDPGEEFNVAEDNPQRVAVLNDLLRQAHTESEVFSFQVKGEK